MSLADFSMIVIIYNSDNETSILLLHAVYHRNSGRAAVVHPA